MKLLNFRLPQPLMLWMEPSANCNLDCDGCPTAAGRRGGQMKLKDFRFVIDQLPWLRVINFWHRGEPLVAPDFALMVAEASRRGIYTQTHSNGILLTRNNLAERIVSAGLNRIGIGVDGPDNETYVHYRKGGTLEQVEAGVRALAEARRRLNHRKPKIVVECLVSRQTAGQFAEVRRLALEWGADEVKFKTYKVPRPDDLDDALPRLPDDPALWRYDRVNGRLQMKLKHRSCRRLTHSAVIAWNGEVYPCCFWTHPFSPIGNAFKQTWKEIWHGEALRQLQRTVNGERDKIAMCRNCTEGLPRLYIPAKELTTKTRRHKVILLSSLCLCVFVVGLL